MFSYSSFTYSFRYIHGSFQPTQLLWLEMTLFSKKALHDIGKQLSQQNIYFVKIKRF